MSMDEDKLKQDILGHLATGRVLGYDDERMAESIMIAVRAAIAVAKWHDVHDRIKG